MSCSACQKKDALIARLCEALEPFATISCGYAQQSDNYEVPIDLAFLRRARSALAAAAQARKGEGER